MQDKTSIELSHMTRMPPLPYRAKKRNRCEVKAPVGGDRLLNDNTNQYTVARTVYTWALPVDSGGTISLTETG